MGAFIIWLLSIELLGIFVFPLTLKSLPQLGIHSYFLSKSFGLVLFAYAVWLLGSLQIIPVSRPVIAAVFLVIAVIGILMWWQQRRQLLIFIRRNLVWIVLAELIFLTMLCIWSLFIALDPAIAHTEQLMDFAFLNASGAASTFPPEDPWFRGESINYYYFGFLILSVPGKLAGVPSSMLYNLSLALIGSLSAIGAMGLVGTIITKAGGGTKAAFILSILSVILLLVASNLEGAFELFSSLSIGSSAFWTDIGIKGLGQSASQGIFPVDDWWWWRASRVIDTVVMGTSLDYTINEFPFFSLALGDLHPHLIAVPFTLLALGFVINICFDSLTSLSNRPSRSIIQIIGFSMVIGAMGFINIWSLPIILSLIIGLFSITVIRALRNKAHVSQIAVLGTHTLLPIILGLSLFAPFYLGLFDEQRFGMGSTKYPATSTTHFLIVWGLFIGLLTPYLITKALPLMWSIKKPLFWIICSLTLVPIITWTLINGSVMTAEQLSQRAIFVLPFVLIATLFVYESTTAHPHHEQNTIHFVALILGLCTIVLMMAELFFLQDIFQNRMNTVFKFYYQVWILLAVVIPPSIYLTLRQFAYNPRFFRTLKLSGFGIGIALLVVCLYYPVGVIATKTIHFDGSWTLDGLAHMEQTTPDERAVIEWVRDHTNPADGILEAVGPDYTAYGRIAASTNRSTVLAWPGHQRQWRGDRSGIDIRETENI